jgi:hypothetical protein
LLILTIGIAGLLVLVFAMIVMYRIAANEEAANAPVPVEENVAQQPPLLPDRPANSNANQPAKPAKLPPLNEH